MTTKEIADRLVALCREGKNIEAVDTLMSDDVVSVEARGDETMPATMSGLDTIRGKNQWWIENHTIHSADIKGPWPNGDRFTVVFTFVVSPKIGPMIGKKVRMEEVALYTVTDGKISREEFFYDMSGGGEVVADKPVRRKATKKKAVKAKAVKAKAVPAKKAKAKVKKVEKPRVAAKSKVKIKAKAKARKR